VDRLHVFLGTKAQYIKTAPLLRLLDSRGVPYRLIDSGQHARLSQTLRRELGVREPDHVLGGAEDVASIPQALAWSARLATRLGFARRLRDEVFGGDGGICVVHGDTPSTLLSALMARRAGLRVAHLEAGLRSHSLLHPFPEEAIRLMVMRVSSILFAPDAQAVRNLADLRVRGAVVPVSGNTVVEALRHSLDREPSGRPLAGSGPVVVTLHRVENLHNRARVDQLVELACRIAETRPVRFVQHGPTVETLTSSGAAARLRAAGVELVPLLPHREFTSALAAAPFVITDGGSVQEEAALLGVPTMLWRARTERPDGLGENVLLTGYDPVVVDGFLADPESFRRDPARDAVSPSEEILEVLLDRLRDQSAPR
jgi:UDP-N-acetylglucosamine 2-epimerase (non-hydrolysing)